MKITVLAENLKRGLSIVNRGISSRPQLPVLSGVLLKASSEGLFLVSTDLQKRARVNKNLCSTKRFRFCSPTVP